MWATQVSPSYPPVQLFHAHSTLAPGAIVFAVGLYELFMTVMPPAGTGELPTGGGGGPILYPPPPPAASVMAANPMYHFFLVTPVPSVVVPAVSHALAVMRSLGCGSHSSKTVHRRER